jgi:hypothetical protein
MENEYCIELYKNDIETFTAILNIIRPGDGDSYSINETTNEYADLEINLACKYILDDKLIELKKEHNFKWILKK